MQYLVSATLLASFEIEAPTSAEAKRKLRVVLAASDSANFGADPDTGDPLLSSDLRLLGLIDADEQIDV